jgi:hypothetical protein
MALSHYIVVIMLNRKSVPILAAMFMLACGNRGAPVPSASGSRSISANLSVAALFQQKKVCHDLGIRYDLEQQKPLPPGSLRPGDEASDLQSEYCYSTTLNTCIWSGGAVLRSRDGRDYTSRRIVDLLTNRELFEYSEQPLRRLNLINGFSKDERAREVSDMNKWSEARHEFEGKREALLRTCAP